MNLAGTRRITSKAFKPRKKQVETSLRTILRKMAESKRPLEADRAHLDRWLGEPRADEIWSTIRKHAINKHRVVSGELFITKVLSCRSLAQNPEIFPPYLGHARSAETLASFLRGPASGELPPPMPNIPNYLSLATALDETARLLREQALLSAKAGFVKNSGKKKSQSPIVFIQFLHEVMNALCGQPLDYEVSVLTDIAFPGSETSIEAARAARRIKNPQKRTKAMHD